MSAHEMKGKYKIFAFIDTGRVDTKALLERLLKYDEVVEVHVISGQYDLLVVLELELYGGLIFTSVREATLEIIEKIRKLDGVRDTNTLVPFFSVTKRVE